MSLSKPISFNFLVSNLLPLKYSNLRVVHLSRPTSNGTFLRLKHLSVVRVTSGDDYVNFKKLLEACDLNCLEIGEFCWCPDAEMEDSAKDCLSNIFALCSNLTSLKLGTLNKVVTHPSFKDSKKPLDAEDLACLENLRLVHFESTKNNDLSAVALANWIPTLRTFKPYHLSNMPIEVIDHGKNQLEHLRLFPSPEQQYRQIISIIKSTKLGLKSLALNIYMPDFDFAVIPKLAPKLEGLFIRHPGDPEVDEVEPLYLQLKNWYT